MAKKKTKTESVSPEALEAGQHATVMAAIRKTYGKDTFVGSSVSDMIKFETQTPTGSLALDMAIGTYHRDDKGIWTHGLPPGKIVEIFGGESVGLGSFVNFDVGFWPLSGLDTRSKRTEVNY